MTEERRKNYHEKLGGMSTGTIIGMITLMLAVIGSIWTGSGTIHNLRADVSNNEQKITEQEARSRLEKEDVKQEVKASEQRTREDIKELRQLIVEKLK